MKFTFKKILLTSVCVISMSNSAFASGIPVFDGAGFAKQIEQLQQHIRDYSNQLSQLEELRRTYENAVSQLTNLEGILGSLTGLNEIHELYNSVEDIAARSEKMASLDGFMNALRVGDGITLEGLFRNTGTVGTQWNAAKIDEVLGTAGLSTERLGELSRSDNSTANGVAAQAAAGATAMASADIAYEEASSSLARVDGLVGEIRNQETMKDSVDLNTRMSAEVAYTLAQIWRLNAASGMSTGQNGINLAAEIQKQQNFFDFGDNQ